MPRFGRHHHHPMSDEIAAAAAVAANRAFKLSFFLSGRVLTANGSQMRHFKSEESERD